MRNQEIDQIQYKYRTKMSNFVHFVVSLVITLSMNVILITLSQKRELLSLTEVDKN